MECFPNQVGRVQLSEAGNPPSTDTWGQSLGGQSFSVPEGWFWKFKQPECDTPPTPRRKASSPGLSSNS